MIKRRLKTPHPLALVFIIMIVIATLTWVVPAGQFERYTNDKNREIVMSGSFQYTAPNPQNIFDVLQAPVKGIRQAAHIIGFILIIGGAFAIIRKTKTIDVTIRRLAQILSGNEKIIIPVGMVLFSVFGAVFGMSEEVIPFILIFIPLALALGYDSIVGTAIPFLGAGLGFAGAMLNPFTVGIAQGIAELPPFSGIVYRSVIWTIVTSAGIVLVMRYAEKVRRQPEKSPVYTIDSQRAEKSQSGETVTALGTRHKLVLVIFFLSIAVMIIGIIKYQWFITEIAAIFLAMGIAGGVAAGLSANDMATGFIAGAQDLIGAALVVGFARAILVLATDGMIVDTILYNLSNVISHVHPVFAAQMMFLLQTVINFFVPSGSGQAALTMPIMAPLADLIGVTRQTAVLAYQMGDGFTNMIIPTSGTTMGVLGVAKISWQTWARWLLPLEIAFFILGLLLLVPAVLINWGPF